MTEAAPPSAAARALHVVICNERLLPRFGVDRLLLLLGRGLVARGHRVTFVCARCDRAAVATVSPALLEWPELTALDLHGAEDAAARRLADHWAELSAAGAPDLVVSGGWPFFRAARVCERFGAASLFIDAGAVPHDGMAEGAKIPQRELRRVRAAMLPRFTAVLPISDFIRDTQTLPDRGTADGVATVLLGADHLDAPMFAAPAGEAADAAALAELGKLTAAGRAPILLLGRFEPAGYKNGPCAYDVLARILARAPEARMLVLARPGELAPPDAVRRAVVPLGFVSDAALGAIMRACRLALSVSLWEGFNLPLAEMQWGGGLALAFNVGAHPEVALDPWLLCGGPAEMADKAVQLLRDGPPPHIGAAAFERFRARFRWQDAIDRYSAIIEAAAAAPRPPASASPASASPARRLVLVDCTNASIDPGNPGVIRVARRLGQAMQQDPALLPVFVRWDGRAGQYRTLAPWERTTLAGYDGPVDGISRLFSPAGQGVWPIDNILDLFERAAPPVLFLPEVVLDGRMPERIVWARARGMPVAALLYDLIPITHAVFCPPGVVARFPEYLEGVASGDAIWAISGETLRQFERYAARHDLPRPADRAAIWLPAQFGAQPRATAGPAPAEGDEIMALCVGSIEPRKNHRTLIEAFRAVLARRPQLKLRLVLAGSRFEGADALADWIAAVAREEPRIAWTGLIQDAELAALIRQSAFTIYPSLVEGYGLPVTESLWLGRPCLCHNGGVMAELAADGGCLTADMSDPAAIGQAIEALADDAALRQRLTEEALRRELTDWQAYGARICGRLRALAEHNPLAPPPAAPAGAATLDTGLAALRLRLHEAAAALRSRPERFVRVTDVAVDTDERV